MNKILKINISDIIIDPARESEMITNACIRSIHMRPTGVCQFGDAILIVMEKCNSENYDSKQNYIYTLAPLNSANLDEVIAEISSRYFAGFSILGGFDVKNEKWALFEKKDLH